MKKRKLLLAMLALFGVSMVHAEDNVTAYAYVQCSGTPQTSQGAAELTFSSAELSFDSDGNAVMTIDNNTVAKLPLLEGAELATDFTNGSGVTSTNTLTVAVSTDRKWSTFFSPFQLQVNTNSNNVEVYAPSYTSGSSSLTFGDNQSDKVIPAGTGLVLKKAGTINFTLTNTTATGSKGSLKGIAVQTASATLLSASTGAQYIYSLGTGSNGVGFYNLGDNALGAGKAYLPLTKAPGASAKGGIAFDFGEITAIDDVKASTGSAQAAKEGKFIMNGRVVIIKGGRMYNLNGQEVK